MTEDRVIRDIVFLSSGTLAGLTGERNYEKLDAIQADFVRWCTTPPHDTWDCWQSAWKAYQVYKEA